MNENENEIEQIKEIKNKVDVKTIKVDPMIWMSLKKLKKENETFSEVIKNLLKEGTQEIGDENIKLIKYGRKILFLEILIENKKKRIGLGRFIKENIGIEIEYNDVKNQFVFTLDLKLKKIYYGKTSTNPSIFFGVDEKHKYESIIYLRTYLMCVMRVLTKEFGASVISDYDLEAIVAWRKIYYNYSLSEESFIEDIESPLNLSVTESPNDEQKNNMLNSPSEKGW